MPRTSSRSPTGWTWSQPEGSQRLAFSTAHDALVSQGGLVAGERALVTGATGGVGTAAVQLAHQLGAFVVASARTERLHRELLELGADVVLTPDDVGDAGPFDVVLELVGAS